MVKIIPIPIKKQRCRGLGYKMIPEPYANIFLCASKNSGKTTLIYNILMHCASKKTKVIFFVPTFYKDESYYKGIVKLLKKKKMDYDVYLDLYEDSKTNILDSMIKELQELQDEDQPTIQQLDKPIDVDIKYVNLSTLMFGSPPEEKKELILPKKKTKTKYLTPEYIFIFDDISNQLRDKSVETLLKKNRHFKCKTIISSQYIMDMRPGAINQLDYLILFKNIPRNKLEQTHEKLALDHIIPFDDFEKLYHSATEKKYNFLVIDKKHDAFRHNFS